MERPKLRKYDTTGSLISTGLQLNDNQRWFAFVNGVWVASYEYLVLTPPPTERTKIDWRE